MNCNRVLRLSRMQSSTKHSAYIGAGRPRIRLPGNLNPNYPLHFKITDLAVCAVAVAGYLCL